MIEFECEHCRAKLKVANAKSGRLGKCKSCQQVVQVPLSNDGGQSISNTSESSPEGSSWRASSSGRMLILTGTFLGVSLFAIVVWAVWGKSTEPYTGPPPPVDFQITEVKVASAVPFGGSLQIRDGAMISPPAPEGYEFGSGEASLFAWKPTSGKLLLVSCKVIVKQPDLQLEQIALMRDAFLGRDREVAALDGIAQPGFDKAEAKDLNEGLSRCYNEGETPTLDLVFRIPDDFETTPSGLSIELRWKNQNDEVLSGKFSLGNVPKLTGESSEDGDAVGAKNSDDP